MQNVSERVDRNALDESQERASSGPPELNGVQKLTIDVPESVVPLELVSLGDGLDNVVSLSLLTARRFVVSEEFIKLIAKKRGAIGAGVLEQIA